MADSAAEKSEQPTGKRRRDARKKGDVLMSKDVVTVSTLVTSFVMLWFLSGMIVSTLEEFFLFCLNLMANPSGDLLQNLGAVISQTYVSSLAKIIFWPVALTIIISVCSTGWQTKWLVSFQSIKPSFSKLNPLEGIKKMFSLKSLVEALKNIVKISILLFIVYQFFVNTVLTFSRYLYMSPVLALAEVLGHIISLVMQIALAFFVIAGFDYAYQWYEYEKKLKMTKQEVKDEYKQTEGDPKIKGKIKQKQFQMAQQRMMSDIKSADVIVKNPTHYAVALRYKKNLDPVPVIVAMGEDSIAFRIITVGERFEVPVVEDVPVARALYAQGELGRPIPSELYGAVAKILSVVMNITKDNLDQYVTPGE